MEAEAVMIKEIYEKILKIERDVEEIKEVLIGEEELSKEEEEELNLSLEEVEKGEIMNEEELRALLREN